jgi:hypothetical protein
MAQKHEQMGRYRAIMTDTDREYISGSGNPTGNQRAQSVSRVRNRITKELPRDIKLLEEHRPDLLDQLREVVCEERAADGGGVDPEIVRRRVDDLEAALEAGDERRVEAVLERLNDLANGGDE